MLSLRASVVSRTVDDVALRDLQGVVGAPWSRPLGGALDQLVVESDALADNPLGDPARRPLYVYRPPGVELDHPRALPTVYVIQGFTGQLDMWLSHSAFEPNMVERVDAMFAARACPDAILVFVDAWTSRGGSQFINSASTGRYLDYLCDEVVAFIDDRYPTIAERDHRGIAGKSSGGYGAMVVPMLRPDVFGALASHAGDALFECCYQKDFPNVARALRDNFDGSYEVFFEHLAGADHFDFARYGATFETYGYASAYSPDLTAPGRALLPFDISTGRLSTTCGRCGSSTIRCGWPRATPMRSGACAGSTSTRARPTSTTWIWARRRSPRSCRRSALPIRSSCSTASTAGSPIGIPARSASW